MQPSVNQDLGNRHQGIFEEFLDHAEITSFDLQMRRAFPHLSGSELSDLYEKIVGFMEPITHLRDEVEELKEEIDMADYDRIRKEHEVEDREDDFQQPIDSIEA